jgi:hypothetical protein
MEAISQQMALPEQVKTDILERAGGRLPAGIQTALAREEDVTRKRTAADEAARASEDERALAKAGQLTTPAGMARLYKTKQARAERGFEQEGMLGGERARRLSETQTRGISEALQAYMSPAQRIAALSGQATLTGQGPAPDPYAGAGTQAASMWYADYLARQRKAAATKPTTPSTTTPRPGGGTTPPKGGGIYSGYPTSEPVG